MKQYLTNLLPRIQQFSKTLDHQENFVDLPWVLIDENGNRQTYIFQRDKTLIMSLNGKAQVGKWSYVPAAESLLIDRGTDKVLLKHAFVDKGLMILKMDGKGSEPWILMNEREVPDLDAQKYLNNIIIKKNNLRRLNVGDKTYYISDPENHGVQNESIFYDENFVRTGDSFKTKIGHRTYTIEKGVVKSYIVTTIYNTDKGPVKVISSQPVLMIGSQVVSDKGPLENGVYKLIDQPEYKSFTLVDGRISSLKTKNSFGLVMGALGAAILIIVVVAFIQDRKSRSGENASPELAKSDTSTTPGGVVTDTTNKMGADTSKYTSYTPTYNGEDCKQRVVMFNDAIDKNEFDKLTDFFPPVVEKYVTDRNLFREDVVKNIRTYLKDEVSQYFVFYDTTSMTAGREGEDYTVHSNQVTLLTKWVDGVPRIIQSEVTYVLDRDLKIKRVSTSVIQQGYNDLALFGVPPEETKSPDDFVRQANKTDFDRMFNRLTSSQETSEFKEALKNEIVLKFGGSVPVYNEWSVTSDPISLEGFCNNLIHGPSTFVGTSEVLRSSNNELTQIRVQAR